MAIRAELTSGRLLHDFATWCTIACLNRIASSGWILATIFTIIFFNMLGLFIYVSVLAVLKYLSLPIATELSIDVTAQKFPRISVCNENPIKRSVVNSDPAFSDIARLMDQYERIDRNMATDDDFGLRQVRGIMHRQKRARLMLRLLMAKVSDESRRAAGYEFEELFSECVYAGRTCSSLDFSSFLHPEFGNCYTFSIDDETTRPGRKEGLRLMMTVNQQSTDKGVFDFMPTTDSASVWAVIHDEGAYPDFMKDGFRVGAGTQALVGLSRVEYARVDRPYGNCSHHGAEMDNYFQNYTYTHAACQQSCLQVKADEICGCADPIFPKSDNHSYCQTPDEMRCLLSLTHTISPANVRGAPPLCQCPQPCAETVYKRTISTSVFPSDNYLVSAGTQAQRSKLLGEQNGGRQGTCNDGAEWYDGQQQACTATRAPTTKTSVGSQPATVTTLDITSSTASLDPSTTTSSTATASTATSTSASTMSTVTTNHIQCPTGKPPAPIKDKLSDDAKKCVDDDRVFKNHNFSVIAGWPCKSNKKCQSCVIIKDNVDQRAWPCVYDTYPDECKDHNDHAVSKEKCDSFFRDFDFIPWGTSTPAFEWNQGKGPDKADCGTFTQEECRDRIQCGLKPTSIGDPQPLLDKEFTDAISGVGNASPCVVSAFAREMALDRLNNANGGSSSGSICILGVCVPIGKRKKRSAEEGKVKPVAVDKPGFGSCEYPNKNFRGAKECIEWYRRNGLIIHVFFETFEVRTYTQAATYTLVLLLSDIAGHAGLWLGMSVVSVVEIIAFFGMWLLKWCFGKKIKISDEEVVEGAEKRGREEKKMYQ